MCLKNPTDTPSWRHRTRRHRRLSVSRNSPATVSDHARDPTSECERCTFTRPSAARPESLLGRGTVWIGGHLYLMTIRHRVYILRRAYCFRKNKSIDRSIIIIIAVKKEEKRIATLSACKIFYMISEPISSFYTYSCSTRYRVSIIHPCAFQYVMSDESFMKIRE